jgi:nanoRNase/pAp phosphatase (c-di-AMP/oligoRNAs hydrolase)
MPRVDKVNEVIVLMSKEQLELLFEAVDGIVDILILPHNDPDPDAIASAVALRYLLEQKLGIEGDIVYRGIIGRAENRALVRYLNHPLRLLTDADLDQSWPLVLVDTQPGTGNNPWSPQARVAVVIDHHPWHKALRVATIGFADIRPDVGAASTVLLEYLQAAGLELPVSLATALFYGIKTDTQGLSRNVSSADASAYFYLQSRIDVEALAEIERAQVPAAYFKSFATTLEATRLYDGTAISYMGQMEYPDMVAEMADLLLRLEGVEWVICIGAHRDTLILSVRTSSPQQGAGKLVQAIVKEEGTAGGHGRTAGGQIPLAGRTPEQAVSQLYRRVLQHLGAGSDTVGQLLI